MDTMKAMVCTRYGPPEVLQLKEVKKPVPGDKEVLVRIVATTVSAADFRCRSFTVPPSFWLPARLALGLRKPRKDILGMEFSGVVEATGKEVKQFKPGDEVFGGKGHHFGAYAEYLCIEENGFEVALAKKPATLSPEDSTAVLFGGLTALYFLREAKITAGQKVLIYGASGSVGTYAVQLARYFGAEVTGVCSTSNLELVRSLGAQKVIDYTREDFTKTGEQYDVIFDAVGKSSISGCLKSLKPEGAFLHDVATPDVQLRMFWESKRTKRKMVGGGPKVSSVDLEYLGKLIDDGKIRPVIDRYYPFEQMVEAHRYVDQGHKKGHVVITLSKNLKPIKDL